MRAVDRRVVELLRSFRDAREAWDSRSGGGGVKLMPSMWNEGSYSEVERVLRLMRDGSPHDRSLWWHVSARYLWTHARIDRVPVARSRLGPMPIAPPNSEVDVVIEMHSRYALARINVWDASAAPARIERGVERIADLMYAGDHGRVVLPRELSAAASAKL